MTTENKDIRLSRENAVLRARENQIELNLKVIAGGRPYIDARLTRLPFEPDASWNGRVSVGRNESKFSKTMGADTTGRSERAFLINYAGRIAKKINQLVFATEPQRANSDAQCLADITRTGTPINTFMTRVSSHLTGAGWCWIGVDRDSLQKGPTGLPVQRSIAEKEASGDRVFWSVWAPNEVVDWHFDRTGTLKWLITEQQVVRNPDYSQPPEKFVLRTIWREGGGVRLWLDPSDKDKPAREEDFTTSINEVCFVPVGEPTAAPWWFDDVEMIQAGMLNLESVHHENLMQSVFPQLIIADTLWQQMENKLRISPEQVLEMIRGNNYPIFEPVEASGLTRYLMPNASDMKAIPDELMRRRQEMLAVVGMALRLDTRQVQSAESKQIDQLDSEAVLKEQALVLEDAETKAVALSKKLDSSFKEYKPVYAKKFNVTDLAASIQSILDLNTLPMPPSGKNELQRAGIELLDREIGVPEARKKVILDDIQKASV